MTEQVITGTSNTPELGVLAGATMDPAAPVGFLRFSDAVNRLTQGMWGGLKRPVAVRTIKRVSDKISVGFGPWRKRAAERLTAAARAGELAVYLSPKPPIACECRAPPRDSAVDFEPVVVAVEVLKRLLTPRGGLPGHPIRPTLKTAGGNDKLLRLLTTGSLVIRENDFAVWYEAERAKGEWSSQRSRSKPRMGRPTKKTDALRNAILARVRNGEWNGKDGITMLQRLLVAPRTLEVPSPDTLTRLVDQLFSETGEPGLLRTARPRRKRALGPHYRKSPA